MMQNQVGVNSKQFNLDVVNAWATAISCPGFSIEVSLFSFLVFSFVLWWIKVGVCLNICCR